MEELHERNIKRKKKKTNDSEVIKQLFKDTKRLTHDLFFILLTFCCIEWIFCSCLLKHFLVDHLWDFFVSFLRVDLTVFKLVENKKKERELLQ